MTEFIPPRMEHVVIDEEMQMQKYLAEIAMEDLLLAPDKRTERPDGLMARYKREIAKNGGVTQDNPMAEEIDGGAAVGLGVIVKVPVVIDFGG